MTVTAVGPCGHSIEFLRTRPNGVRDCLQCRRGRDRRRLTAEQGGRLPIVYAAPGALEHWQSLAPTDRPLENVCRDALLAGTIRYDAEEGGGAARVALGGGLVGILRRTRSAVSGRRGWLVCEVRPR